MVRHGVGLDFIPVRPPPRAASRSPIAGQQHQRGGRICDVSPDASAPAALSPRQQFAQQGLERRAPGGGRLYRTQHDHARHPRRRYHRPPHCRYRARRFWHERARHLPTKGSLPAGVEEVSLEDLFARSDAIAVCCALTDETRGMVSRALIARMRPHAVLVNVSRGAVIETPALVEALKAHRIGGAALDVFDVQPLPTDNALFELSQPAADAAHRRHHRHQRPRDGGRLGRGNASYPARRAAAQSGQSRLQGGMRSHHAHYFDQGRSDLLPRAEGQNVRLGIGRAVKRDAVLVKVSTDEGLTGWGEAHHGRCPGAIAKLIEPRYPNSSSAWMR